MTQKALKTNKTAHSSRNLSLNNIYIHVSYIFKSSSGILQENDARAQTSAPAQTSDSAQDNGPAPKKVINYIVAINLYHDELILFEL